MGIGGCDLIKVIDNEPKIIITKPQPIQNPQPKPKIEIYEKLEETKDGLNIYKCKYFIKPGLNKKCPYYCPICKGEIDLKDQNEIFLNVDSGPAFIEKCYEDYKKLVEDKNQILIFDKLAEISLHIKLSFDSYDEYCYYKYTCRQTNETFYLHLFHLTKEEAQKTFKYKHEDRRYDYSQWKDNTDLLDILFKERVETKSKIDKEEKIKKFREQVSKARIDIKEQWDKFTLEKEYNIYLNQVNYIKSRISFGFSGSYADLMQLLYRAWNFFSYIGGKKKIAEFLSQYANSQGTKDWFLSQAIPGMNENEKKEYQKFEYERIPKITIRIDPNLAKGKKRVFQKRKENELE